MVFSEYMSIINDLNLPKKREIKVQPGLVKRILAFIFDFFIVIFLTSPFSTVIQSTLEINEKQSFSGVYNAIRLQSAQNQQIFNKLVLINFLILVIAFLYFVSFEYILGQTPGNILFNLLVVSKKKGKMEIFQVMIRNLFIILNFIIIIDFIYYMIKQTRLSDYLSKTKVVEVIRT